MNNRIFIIVICLLFSLNIFSQVEHTCEVEQIRDGSLSEDTIKAYIPDEFTVMKYVKVNFHFMMKSDSTLNFRPTDDGLGNCSFTAYDYSRKLLDYVNQRLGGNQQMHLPPGNSTAVLDRKYRLVLKDIYFHYDDNAYTYRSNSPGWLSSTEIAYYSINSTTEINIFFVYDDDPGGYHGGGNAVMNGDRYVRIKAAWQKYRDYGEVGFWADAWTIIHETGHNFGLFHTMHANWGACCDTCDDECSDTPTIPDILNLGYPNPCPSWGDETLQYSNNVMDYSGLIAVTPEQLGIVHYTLANDMVNYLESSDVSFFPESIVEGNHSLLWQNDTVLKTSLRIKDGGVLTIEDCLVHVYKTARIIVEPGGKLILDGATLTNECETMWPGIEVWGNSSTHQQASNGSYFQGYLELKNGATIENAMCAVELCRPGVSGTSGGIVFADSAFFTNNAKAKRVNYPYSGRLASALLGGGFIVENARSFCPELPKKADKGKDCLWTDEHSVMDFLVTISPNPILTQVKVNYILPKGSSHAVLIVFNILGEKMMEIGLEGNVGSKTVDLYTLSNGIYFFIVVEQYGRISLNKVIRR